MSSSFRGPFDEFDGDSPAATEKHSFEYGYVVPELFSNYGSTVADSPPPIYVPAGEFPSDPLYFSPVTNDNGPILPPPAEMESDESYAIREWRRQNAIWLEEKEKREKELLGQIIVEADEYKVEFHRKSQITCKTKREINREKEKVFIASQERFHAEADKDYWKSIAELIPKEAPTTQKRKGKEEHEKKPSIVVVQGPKPGKRTDLSRMRQILLKLKHYTPPHLKPSTLAPKGATSAAAAVPVSTEAVVVA